MTDLAVLRARFDEKSLDVTALGAAIVDVVLQVDDSFLAAHDAPKGGMTLIDSDRAETIHSAMSASREVSGGSAANTVAMLAALGGRSAFAGKTRKDRLGELFRNKIQEVGVRFETPAAGPELPGATARSMILVTPDAQRTMCTDLGVSGMLTLADLPAEAIRNSKVVYLEGYLWDSADAKLAFQEASRIAKDAGGLTALTLSDGFCVDRHRISFKQLVADQVDILFANEEEILSLYETQDLDAAIEQAAAEAPLAVITRSEKGCIVANGARREAIPAADIRELVDTTGAGDAFAAGFLFGFCQGADLSTCGRMGCVAAAEVIQHLGARPESDMKALFVESGFAERP